METSISFLGVYLDLLGIPSMQSWNLSKGGPIFNDLLHAPKTLDFMVFSKCPKQRLAENPPYNQTLTVEYDNQPRPRAIFQRRSWTFFEIGRRHRDTIQWWEIDPMNVDYVCIIVARFWISLIYEMSSIPWSMALILRYFYPDLPLHAWILSLRTRRLALPTAISSAWDRMTTKLRLRCIFPIPRCKCG